MTIHFPFTVFPSAVIVLYWSGEIFYGIFLRGFEHLWKKQLGLKHVEFPSIFPPESDLRDRLNPFL